MWVTRAVYILCAWFVAAHAQWRCPILSARPSAECSCDLPHTLRCAGDHTALQIIGRHLREEKARNKNTAISLLDCALRGVTVLSSAAVAELAGVGLHGLVISSGDIRRVQQGAFNSVSPTLMALGLPNNQLPSLPTEALSNLKNLERLDMSNNKIYTLEPNSFKGISNLSYLDLSDNQIADISPEAFKPLVKLSVLRLRGNLLKVSALANLKEAHILRDLDLSSNALEGPLGPYTVPPLSSLTTLYLSDNTFASIRRGALSGLPNLTHLNLHNNQIDVLEDYAFKHLTNLTHLDLSHNEIVAVSGASLARLSSLSHLDLSHNFLRSLSAEPLKSLERLAELLLHDNDISMIDDGALAQHKDLARFTIEDNPLNCDCLMAGFARWLREAKNLPQTDKSVAVCATPPHLEGALLSRLSKSKLCDDIEHIESKPKENYDIDKASANSIVSDMKPNKAATDYIDSSSGADVNDKMYGLEDDLYDDELDVPSEEDLPVSESKIRLLDAWHDDEEVHLSWSVDPPSSHRYRCTGVTVSRAGGLPKHVACHRAAPSNVVIRGLKIDAVDKYTDNPLNCDCLMAGFARWLREAKNLPQTDKSVAVCATPPHLEGALLSRLSKSKLCDDIEHIESKPKENYDIDKASANSIVSDMKPNKAATDYIDSSSGADVNDKMYGLEDDLYDDELDVPSEEDLPVSESKIRLLDAWHDDEEVHLSWSVDPPSSHRYRCTGVTVSRAGGLPKHVACHRAAPSNVVIRGLKIDAVDKYTFCIALEEMDNADMPVSLILGCGPPVTVRQRAAFATIVPIIVTRPPPTNHLRVTEVRSNITSDGVLTTFISVDGLPDRLLYVTPLSQRLSSNCYVVLAILSRGSLVAQKDTPCQPTLEISMEGLMRGPYEACAGISQFKTDKARTVCVIPQYLEPGRSLEMKAGLKNLNGALIGLALGLMFMVIVLVLFVKKILKKTTTFDPHCLRQDPPLEEIPRANYVMLSHTATSTV